MNVKDRVLVIEDEQRIEAFLVALLEANEYDVIVAHTGQEAMSLVSSHCPDLILLDLGLPDMDGIEVLRAVRRWSHMPVLVVSARTEELDKVEALDAGADDYITKPFGTAELLARIRAAIRHTRTVSANEELANSGVYQVGGLCVDYNKRRVFIDGRDANLTQNEFRLVALLGRSAGRVITYDAIMQELWGPNMKTDNQILRVNMANIRRKIEKNPADPQYIFTEARVGYRMAESGDFAGEPES